ncbi:FAD-dependent oxidoreductase [Alloiococcus sp. CFN-8]|uniref:FAD-dependent oxidoreductase n=1 Tax=Alloiococcus sp. CFN-8 TaxID=3416081 RepID=UPI003CE78268
MDQLYDVIIIGGGPAGLSAALYGARAKQSVLVIEKEKSGGQITITEEVVNYPGVASGSGKEITEVMRQQAVSFGASFLSAEVKELELQGDYKRVITTKGELKALAVVIATGASPRKLGFPGEKEFQGRGVANCATCDGEFFTGLDVFVVGAGFAAAEEAMFLTRFAKKVRIIAREPEFTCAKSIGDKVKAHEGIDIFFNTEVKEIGGNNKLEYAKFINNITGDEWEYRPENPAETFGVFVFAGYVPSTELVKGKVQLDDFGYIITDRNQMTDIPGVYAAGDVCVKNLRQVVTAVADGAIAATSLEKYIADKYQELNLQRQEKVGEPAEAGSKVAESSAEVEVGTKEISGTFITAEMSAQLKPIFSKLEKKLRLVALLDDRGISEELKIFLKELSPLTDNISYELHSVTSAEAEEYKKYTDSYPALMFFNEEGVYLGIQYHGVPGGHEFNSFVIALYNAAGPGQPLDKYTLDKIKGLNKKINMKVFVSLACTMCPEVVMGSQRIALENQEIEAEMYDLAHYPHFKEKYSIMSVPCLVINDKEIAFGKKSTDQILELIESA